MGSASLASNTSRLSWFAAFAVVAFTAFAAPALAADWHEVRSPHFVVISDAGEKKARDVARNFEEIRGVFRAALSSTDEPNMPVHIFAVKSENGLKELFPQFWERDGARPVGVFRRAPDKYLIAVRTDLDHRSDLYDRSTRGADRWEARWENPYRTIYHEYFHLLTSVNMRRLPIWLNEGLAQFWAETVIRDDRVELGNPNWHHLEYLQQANLLPLRDVLGSSLNPHQERPHRVAVFYAQAWALTHWLMVSDKSGSGRETIAKYRKLVAQGEDPVVAFERLVGSLDDVEAKLRAYARVPQKNGMRMDIPVDVDAKSFTARELSEAESLAARGNFLVSGERSDHALPLLRRALALDPTSSVALSSLGLYHYAKDEEEQAREWLDKAIRSDAKSFVTFFYRAMLAKTSQEGDGELVEASLLRSLELNPRFARAHAELGSIYSQRTDQHDAALSFATKAVELQPDSTWLWVNLGTVLLRLDLVEKAVDAEQSASRVAQTSSDKETVQWLSDQIARYRARAMVRREVRGVVQELRCLPGQQFDFVLVAADVTYVLHTSSPRKVTVLENGEITHRGFTCGPQQSEVEATFAPAGGSAASGEVRGELRTLNFLTKH